MSNVPTSFFPVPYVTIILSLINLFPEKIFRFIRNYLQIKPNNLQSLPLVFCSLTCSQPPADPLAI